MYNLLASIAFIGLPLTACALVDIYLPETANTLPPTMHLTPADAKALRTP